MAGQSAGGTERWTLLATNGIFAAVMSNGNVSRSLAQRSPIMRVTEDRRQRMDSRGEITVE
jgi:hypothetical protein